MENNNYNGLNVINPNRQRFNDSTRASNPKRSIKNKKKINKANLLKRRLVFAGVAISLGAVSVNLIDSVTKHLEEQKIITDAIREYNPIVKENTHILRDEDGKPIYNGTDAVIMIDTNNIGNWIEDQIEQGANEAAVVYGIYSNLPIIDEKENNFYDILEAANLSADWAVENGYTGMDDKSLEDAVNQEYINEYYNTSIEKNIGGK